MDKYEYNLKLEEINRMVDNENYEDAAKIADTVDWKRIRNARTLCMVSEIYEINGRLEESKAVLMRAYRLSQIMRIVLYRLTEVAIKMKDFDEAIEYYGEFVNAAPNDNSRYILKYKIYRGRGSSLEEQIAVLEDYREREYTEKWGYELAKLYHKAGDQQKCIEVCDDLVLWFRQGRYVVKALELKKSMVSLSPVQQSIYDHRDEQVALKSELMEAAVPALEKVILEKMPSSEEEAMTDNIITETQRELAQAVTLHAAEVEANREAEDEEWRFSPGAIVSEETKPSLPPVSAVVTEETKDLSGFNAADMQQELANSMREIVSGMTTKDSNEGVIEPMNDKDFFDEEEQDSPVNTESTIIKDEDEIEGQMSIDDILTAMVAEESTSQDEAEAMVLAALKEDAEEALKPEKEDTSPTAMDTIDFSEAVERAAGVADMKPAVELPKQETFRVEENKAENESYISPKLTPDEQYIFSYFSTIQGLREDIALALQEVRKKVRMDRTSKSGNLVITGMAGSGRTTLAIRFAKVFSKTKGEMTARVAKIYAEDFNKKDIPSTVAKIAGGTLVIEEAGDLQDSVIQQLSKAMEFRTDGLVIILEDEKNLLKAIFEKHPDFAEKFTSEVNVPIFTNDELVSFGRTYAFDEDYKIDNMATLALYNRIGDLQSSEHPVTVSDVKEVVDKAIKRSERFGIRKLAMILGRKRYDEDDRIILYEKDFK